MNCPHCRRPALKVELSEKEAQELASMIREKIGTYGIPALSLWQLRDIRDIIWRQ